jgi:hypothetical protein
LEIKGAAALAIADEMANYENSQKIIIIINK